MSPEFVAAKRRLCASWAAIGRMIGRSEHDTRREYDPAYAPVFPWCAPRPPKPPPEPSGAYPPLTTEHVAARVLVAIVGGAASRAEIARAIGRNSRDIGGLIMVLHRRRLIDVDTSSLRRQVYTPTAHGVRELDRLGLTRIDEAAAATSPACC